MVTYNAMTITILGDGGWGTTLAIHLAKKGYKTRLWGAFPEHIKTVKKTGENKKFLPGVILPANIDILSDISKSVAVSDIIILAVPSQYMREVLVKIEKANINDKAIILSAAKGIENDTNKRMSEIIKEILGNVNLAVLSGPSIAYEVAREIPTTVVISSTDDEITKKLQDILITDKLRVYTSSDVVGVELGGALKNIVAIAAGIGDGLGLGSNAKAATLTRGLAEISRLGVAMGAKRETFSGLSGMGDLVTTCISSHGRNRWFGEELGKGRKTKEILGSTEMVVEGVATAKSAYELAKIKNVDIPITNQVYQVIYKDKDPKRAVYDLMTRAPKAEA